MCKNWPRCGVLSEAQRRSAPSVVACHPCNRHADTHHAIRECSVAINQIFHKSSGKMDATHNRPHRRPPHAVWAWCRALPHGPRREPPSHTLLARAISRSDTCAHGLAKPWSGNKSVAVSRRRDPIRSMTDHWLRWAYPSALQHCTPWRARVVHPSAEKRFATCVCVCQVQLSPQDNHDAVATTRSPQQCNAFFRETPTTPSTSDPPLMCTTVDWRDGTDVRICIVAAAHRPSARSDSECNMDVTCGASTAYPTLQALLSPLRQQCKQ